MEAVKVVDNRRMLVRERKGIFLKRKNSTRYTFYALRSQADLPGSQLSLSFRSFTSRSLLQGVAYFPLKTQEVAARPLSFLGDLLQLPLEGDLGIFNPRMPYLNVCPSPEMTSPFWTT